jgi:hypothetical protein
MLLLALALAPARALEEALALEEARGVGERLLPRQPVAEQAQVAAAWEPAEGELPRGVGVRWREPAPAGALGEPEAQRPSGKSEAWAVGAALAAPALGARAAQEVQRRTAAAAAAALELEGVAAAPPQEQTPAWWCRWEATQRSGRTPRSGGTAPATQTVVSLASPGKSASRFAAAAGAKGRLQSQ